MNKDKKVRIELLRNYKNKIISKIQFVFIMSVVLSFYLLSASLVISLKTKLSSSLISLFSSSLLATLRNSVNLAPLLPQACLLLSQSFLMSHCNTPEIILEKRNMYPAAIFSKFTHPPNLKGELQCKTTQKEVKVGPKTRVSSVLVF